MMPNEMRKKFTLKEKLFFLRNKKIALAHDFLSYLGGAERVTKEIAVIFPRVPIYTLFFEKKMKEIFPHNSLRTSFLQKMIKFIPRKWLLPLYPTATESLDFREFDLVISSTSAFTKGIVVKPKTLHLSYCHTPTRYLWDCKKEYLNKSPIAKSGPAKKFMIHFLLNYLRIWDQEAAERPDKFLANSDYTAQRIKKYYHREAEVIYPPVDINRFRLSKQEGSYFLIVSRLSSYKRVDIVVEAFNRLGWPLKIVGTGEEEASLKRKAGPNIEFLGFVRDRNLPKIYAGCRALIFPGEDDFGLTMVEAMATGKPVLAYRKGGALEIVEEGKTGLFFDTPNPEILIDGLRRLKEKEEIFKREYIRERALRFSKKNFRTNFINAVFDTFVENER